MDLERRKYDEAIIGVDTNGRIVYDHDKILELICKNCECDYAEAEDNFCYNIERSIAYLNKSDAPIVIYPIESMM